MNKLIAWYTRNYVQITWFLIGWIGLALLLDFSRGDWANCLFDVFLIAVNVYFVKK